MKRSVPKVLALLAFLFVAACSPLPKGVVGLATQVSKTGVMLENTFYNNGKEVAKILYDESGTPTKIEGKIPDGPAKQMLSEKVVGMELNYRNNLKDGPYKILSHKGKVIGVAAEGAFKADKLDGINNTYNEQGVLTVERSYKDGALDGPSRWYAEDGSLKVEKNYSLGKENGKFIWKDKTGKITGTEIWRNGKKIK
jgi:antitoxin component YwqK of YwqJK toxin-antitoxin module